MWMHLFNKLMLIIYNIPISWTLLPEQDGMNAKSTSASTGINWQWDDFWFWSQTLPLPSFKKEKAGWAQEKKRKRRTAKTSRLSRVTGSVQFTANGSVSAQDCSSCAQQKLSNSQRGKQKKKRQDVWFYFLSNTVKYEPLKKIEWKNAMLSTGGTEVPGWAFRQNHPHVNLKED